MGREPHLHTRPECSPCHHGCHAGDWPIISGMQAPPGAARLPQQRGQSGLLKDTSPLLILQTAPTSQGPPPDFSPCSLPKSIACSSRSRSSHRPLPAWNVPPDTAGLPPLLRALLGVIFPSGLPGCCSKQGPDPLPAFSLSSRHFFRSAPHPTLFTQHLELSSEHSRHSTRSLCEWVSKQNGSTACEGLGVTLCVRASEAPSQDATHPSTPAHGSNQTSHGLNLQQV